MVNHYPSPIGHAIKLHFQRFEFKYLLRTTDEAAIKRRMLPYLAVDAFAADLPKQTYEVFSLYYDSPAFYYYHQKMDGVSQRKKVRLRTYRNNGIFAPNAFFEIKRKHDAVILKDRFVMSEDDYRKVLQHEDFHSTLAIRDKNRKNIIEEFSWETHLRSISPKVLVLYEREPYLGKYNRNFRVTFDRNIRAIQNDNLFYQGNEWQDVSGPWTVMELKFTGMLPFYVSEVIKEFNLERNAYSKYCHAVDACGALSAETFAHPISVREHLHSFAQAQSAFVL